MWNSEEQRGQWKQVLIQDFIRGELLSQGFWRSLELNALLHRQKMTQDSAKKHTYLINERQQKVVCNGTE